MTQAECKDRQNEFENDLTYLLTSYSKYICTKYYCANMGTYEDYEKLFHLFKEKWSPK